MRDCENCKHRVMKVEVGKGTPPEHFWGCECWECEFEPTAKNDLGVDCISREQAIIKLSHDLSEVELPRIKESLDDLPSVYPKSDIDKINELAKEAINATGQSDAYSHGMCNGIEYMRAVLTETKPSYLDGNYRSDNSVLEDIKAEIQKIHAWGDSFGNVYVDFVDVIEIIDSHISGGDTK